MLTTVPVGTKSFSEYEPFVNHTLVKEIKTKADHLRGARVLHISSTAFGGGVAELLYTLVPLMNDLGVETDWQLISGSEEFFTVTKLIHNGLQGMPVPLTSKMRETYLNQTITNSQLFEEEYDFIMVHDPQPAGILKFLEERRDRPGQWVWRCHIDLTASDLRFWEFLKPYLDIYDAAIFTSPGYIKDDLKAKNIHAVPPSIDPLSPKNIELDQETIASVMDRYKIDQDRPLIVQVSRFDPWKDPLGAIDAYRQAKKDFPKVQLAMIASMATDDPEGFHYYEKTARHADNDPDVHLLSNLEGVGNLEVNAFQRAADAVMQKSVREGFGLVVSEALWKNKPVVGGNVGGIPSQIIDGVNGFLVDDSEECAKALKFLLKYPEKAAAMGDAGRLHVRENFLSPRQIKDYFDVFLAMS